MLEKIHSLRLEGHSSQEISDLTGVPFTTTVRRVRQFDKTLSPEQTAFINDRIKEKTRLRVHESHAKRRGVAASVSPAIKAGKQPGWGRLQEVSPTRRGIVGEFYAKYYLARHGLEVAEPSFLSEALDLLVLGASGKVYRCEVKASSKGNVVRIHRTRYSKGSLHEQGYAESDRIDFFILVTLEDEGVYIVPFSEYQTIGVHVTCSEFSHVSKYRDAIHLFE